VIFREASLANPDDREMLQARPDLLEFSDEVIGQGHCRVAIDVEGRVVGFSSYLLQAEHVELVDLFVDPSMWRHGVGRALIDDVVTVTRDGPSARIEVTANTNALAFYEGTGFVLDHPADTELVPGLRMHLDVEH
jgi:GNAT superfamily N-acetyltransferase